MKVRGEERKPRIYFCSGEGIPAAVTALSLVRGSEVFSGAQGGLCFLRRAAHGGDLPSSLSGLRVRSGSEEINL